MILSNSNLFKFKLFYQILLICWNSNSLLESIHGFFCGFWIQCACSFNLDSLMQWIYFYISLVFELVKLMHGCIVLVLDEYQVLPNLEYAAQRMLIDFNAGSLGRIMLDSHVASLNHEADITSHNLSDQAHISVSTKDSEAPLIFK